MSKESEARENAIPDEEASADSVEDAESAEVSEEDEERLTGEIPDPSPFTHP